MTDIVERLRNKAFFERTGTRQDINEAADEIERLTFLVNNKNDALNEAMNEVSRLRAQLAQLRSVAGAVSLDGPLMPSRDSINNPLTPEES